MTDSDTLNDLSMRISECFSQMWRSYTMINDANVRLLEVLIELGSLAEKSDEKSDADALDRMAEAIKESLEVMKSLHEKMAWLNPSW